MRQSPRIALARTFGLLATIATAYATPAWSQAALVLQYPINARAAGMGETGVADNSNPANIFFNPANVVGPARAYVQGTRWEIAPFGEDSDIWTGGGSAGVSYARPEGSEPAVVSADVSYGRFDYGESVATDPAGNPLGTFHSFEDYYALTVGVGFVVGDWWDLRLGGAVKRWAANFAPAEFGMGIGLEFDAFAYDLGLTVARRATVSEWSVVPAFAAAFVNFGPEIDIPDRAASDPLPTRFHFGTSVRVESPVTHVLSADVPLITVVYNVDGIERLHGERFSWGIGGELAVAQILFVRAGSFDYEDDNDSFVNDGSGWGVGVGLPIGSLRARFDYTKTSVFYWEDKYGFELDWML